MYNLNRKKVLMVGKNMHMFKTTLHYCLTQGKTQEHPCR